MKAIIAAPGPVMPANTFGCRGFILRGVRIPAPAHSFKN